MSGRAALFVAVSLLGGVFTDLLCMPAHAATGWDWTTVPFTDPLLTRPPVLEAGVVLPGDTAALVCPPPATIHPEISPDAAEPEASTLTLARAVDLALCHNPQLQGTWAAIKVQAAAVGEARAAYLPTLTLSNSRLEDRTHVPGAPVQPTTLRNNTQSAALAWRLFDFGGREANRRSANAQLLGALLSYDAALQKTLTSVIGAYFDVQTALATRQAKRENEALARQTLVTAQRRETRGAGAQTDSLQAATALARVSLDRSRADGAYQRAVAVLAYALGEPAATQLILAPEADEALPEEHQDLTAWLAQAEAQHPAIAGARAQLEASREKVISVRSDGLPTLDLTGNYYQNGRPNQGLSATRTAETLVGVTVNIPLFEGFARTYKVRGAQAQVELQEAALQDTGHQILLEVVKAHADAVAALANLQASQQLSSAAYAALTSVQRKFDKGATDILEILGTQTALSDARQERIRCLAEWRSARLRLMASAGALGVQRAASGTAGVAAPARQASDLHHAD